MRSSISRAPEISVVVLHHTGDFIYSFIESIRKQTFEDFDVIVLTSDEKLAMQGIKDCLVVHCTKMPAEKRNIGVRLSRANYIAFFDDDTEIDPKCLEEFYKYMQKNNEVGMVYGKLWNGERRDRFDEAGGFLTWTGFIWSRAGQNDIDKGQYNKAETIFAGKSASCMIRKRLFYRIGGFDEDFEILGEESDLSWRVWLFGKEVHYVPKATGYHWFNTSKKDTSKHYTNTRVFFNGSRNYITMLFKNLEWRNVLWVLPIHVAIWSFAGLAMLFTGKFKQGWNIWKGILYVPLHLKGILKKRGQTQFIRRVSDRKLWSSIFRRPPGAYYRTRLARYITLGLHG